MTTPIYTHIRQQHTYTWKLAENDNCLKFSNVTEEKKAFSCKHTDQTFHTIDETNDGDRLMDHHVILQWQNPLGLDGSNIL